MAHGICICLSVLTILLLRHCLFQGIFVCELGSVGAIQAETEGILLEHDIATEPFTTEVRDEGISCYAATSLRPHHHLTKATQFFASGGNG